MSIAAGYVSRAGQPLVTGSLRDKVLEYRILPSEQGGEFLTDVRPMRFGHLISKYKGGYRHQTPTVIDQDGNLLMTSGYVLSRGSQDADAHRHLLTLCVQTGGKVLEECEGEFVSVFAEGRSGTVHIVNDRFGACPFFLLDTGERIVFSSNLAFLCFLAGGRLESDVLGWLQIAAWDHTIGSRTHLREVRKLLPASHVTLSSEPAAYKQYWHPRPQVDEMAAPTSTARRVFEAFQGATRRRSEWLGNGMIALSGGLDSRMVAGALPERSHFSAWTFVDSMGVTDTLQLSVANQVSSILGLPHTVKPIPHGVLSPQLARDIVALTGGVIALQHSVKTMQGISVMREAGVDAQMGGAPAGSLSGSYVRFPEYVDPAKTDECMRAFVRSMSGRGQTNLFGRLFHRDILREHQPRLASSLMESLEGVEGPTAAHRVSVWKLMNRNFGFTFTCPIHSHPNVTEAQPHLGYEYVDLMLQLPAPWLYRRAFYQFMIFQSLPSLRDVIYANTGKRLSGKMEPDSDRDRSWRSYYRLRRVIGRSVRAMVPARRRERTFLFDLLSNAQLLNEMVEIVRSHPFLVAVLDVGKCTRFVADCRDGRIQGTNADHARLLGTLATMCYAVESFDRPSTASH